MVCVHISLRISSRKLASSRYPGNASLDCTFSHCWGTRGHPQNQIADTNLINWAPVGTIETRHGHSQGSYGEVSISFFFRMDLPRDWDCFSMGHRNSINWILGSDSSTKYSCLDMQISRDWYWIDFWSQRRDQQTLEHLPMASGTFKHQWYQAWRPAAINSLTTGNRHGLYVRWTSSEQKLGWIQFT